MRQCLESTPNAIKVPDRQKCTGFLCSLERTCFKETDKEIYNYKLIYSIFYILVSVGNQNELSKLILLIGEKYPRWSENFDKTQVSKVFLVIN